MKNCTLPVRFAYDECRGGELLGVSEKVSGSDLVGESRRSSTRQCLWSREKSLAFHGLQALPCILILECGCQNNLETTVRRKHNKGAGPPYLGLGHSRRRPGSFNYHSLASLLILITGNLVMSHIVHHK